MGTEYKNGIAITRLKPVEGGGGGEPSSYIKDAAVSEDGNTLNLTKKDNSVVSFSKPTIATTIDSSSVNTETAGAKAVYDYVSGVVGDIESTINVIRGI